MQRLASLVNLRTLALGPEVTSAGMPYLSSLTKLEALKLSHSQVNDIGLEDLGKLPSLKHLDLSNTPVTDAGLERLQGLTHLQTLDLAGHRYPRPVSPSCRKHFPNCESTSELELMMNSRLRTCLLVSLVMAGWLAFAPAKAEAQGFVARAAVNQYLNGGYGGYGGYGYGYQPQYYGGYGNGYSYGNGGYGYGSSYPAFGYNAATATATRLSGLRLPRQLLRLLSTPAWWNASGCSATSTFYRSPSFQTAACTRENYGKAHVIDGAANRRGG